MGLNYCKIKKNVKTARNLVIDGTTDAGSGHPGGSFSMAEIVGTLFGKHLRYDPKNPSWEDRDRLVLSKGHAAPGLFSNLAVAGYFDSSQLLTLRKFESKLQGHPDLKCPGVEFCGGSLGIGLSFSLGVALAGRMDNKDYHVYTIMGDGESNEGQVWEAAMAASKFKTDNLTVILDRNFIQQDSFTEKIMPLDECLLDDNISKMWKNSSRWRTGAKWKAFGWNVIEIDGHRIEQISDAINSAKKTKGMPTIIIARTIKGKAVEHMEDNPAWHGKAPASDIAPIIRSELDMQFSIAPSIIAGDMQNLDKEVERCVDARADMIHMDVMDGKFVSNKTFGYEKLAQLRLLTVIPFDTHLMIKEPLKHVKEYAEAGSDIITVHAEECDEYSFGEIHDYLHSNDIGIGLAINPTTELPEWSVKFSTTLDQVIVMSVIPGKSGQKYIESSHKKTQHTAEKLSSDGFKGVIEIDGGVNLENARACFIDGARSFVGGGSMVGRSNVRDAIHEFRQTLLQTRRSLLIKKANDLGGEELVQRWINLHLGEKRDKLLTIRQENASQ
ncbi:MAG: ribulose-phosphate 3-epimerase [Cenarchaeum symbiont of Oopsacas minuta]|nr:ribulose-phosphate 3-epimerase [Cenarchaeum symbiont of Oopsacas minuta]